MRGGEAGFETLKCIAEMGTLGVKLVSVDRLQQLDVSYATESQETKDTGRSANLVFWTSD